ncbi:MAG: serine/threonine protein phosphatase [Hyphomicrobiales bacterium]|nr:serine/threonine protein phosphatase [Hyphomicrobiales bacterium]
MRLLNRVLKLDASQHSKSHNTVHREASTPDHTRIYAVGDIHGCFDKLVDLSNSIAADLLSSPVLHTTFVFMGDYIDRGQHSREVLDYLSTLMEDENAVFLRGNHESIFLRFLDDPRILGDWRRHGGIETLESYGVPVHKVQKGFGFEEARTDLLRRLPQKHLDFLLATRPSYVAGDYFFCHAGVKPSRSLTRQDAHDLMWIREEFMSFEGRLSKKIVHGHTPVRRPENRPGRINVDTGVYSSGKLSCAVLEGTMVRFMST